MNMKKCLKSFVSVLLMIPFLFTMTAYAAVGGINIDEYSEEFNFSDVTDSVSDETKAILEELGIDEISYEDLFSVELSKVFDALFNMWGSAVREPLAFLAIAVGVLILTSVTSGLVRFNETVNVIGGAALALFSAVPVANAVTNGFSVLEALSAFTTGFAGVFCALVSSSGNVALGTSYASLAVLSDTMFSALLSGVSQPAVNAMCSLSFLSCFDVYSFSSKLSDTVKKLYISFLGFIATFFSGIVTLKGVLGAGADSLTARGVRFVVGRTLPVVGGAVSETYSALVSSLSLIRNTVGIFGIATVVLTVLPTLLQLIAWVGVLSVAVTVSQFLNSENSVGMLSVLKDALILLGATIVFSAVIFVVSVGVVIFIKGV